MHLVASIGQSVRLSVRPSVSTHGSALPSAAKSNEESISVHGVYLCVEWSSGYVNRLLIFFLFFFFFFLEYSTQFVDSNGMSFFFTGLISARWSMLSHVGKCTKAL